MLKTIITHFFNEEYLLPWWLEHHKKHFDFGLLINYASTDRSVEIIKDICPTWSVVDSINEWFDAKLCDQEVMTYEKELPGWKVVLNTTEFLVGNYEILNDEPEQELKIPCIVMVDEDPDQAPTYSLPLVDQKQFGIPYDSFGTTIRRPRCIHNRKQLQYSLGRHYENYDTTDLKVLWYGFSPYTPELVNRKLQIQNRIPHVDRMRGFGTEHFVTVEQLNDLYKKYQQQAVNIKEKYNV